MECIHLPFVVYPQQDEETAGNAQSEADDIEEGEETILPEIAPGKFTLVPVHRRRVFYQIYRIFRGYEKDFPSAPAAWRRNERDGPGQCPLLPAQVRPEYWRGDLCPEG